MAAVGAFEKFLKKLPAFFLYVSKKSFGKLLFRTWSQPEYEWIHEHHVQLFRINQNKTKTLHASNFISI